MGYSRAVRVGPFIYVSGSAPVGADGELVGEGDAYAQTTRCIEVIRDALGKAGASLEHVVRTRMFVTDIEHWQEIGKAHQEAFGDIAPATSMVEVCRLIDPAMLVEIEDDVFYMRQLSACKNGSIIDLNKRYTPTTVQKAPPAAALIFGDTHAAFADEGVAQANFEGPQSMAAVLNPRRFVWHDVFDNYVGNWHDQKNPFIALAKHRAEMSCVRAEVKLTCDYVNRYGKGRENVIVPSNHNEGLSRWILDTDWKKDPANMEFYLETALAMVENTSMTESGASTVDPFSYWAAKMLKVPHKLLKRDEAYAALKIELAMHGDIGPNGSRGSLANLKRIGVKSVIGHSHSPGIEEGCFQVGTNSKLKVQYNRGPSSWLHTNCVVYANGKRSLLHVIDGRWKI